LDGEWCVDGGRERCGRGEGGLQRCRRRCCGAEDPPAQVKLQWRRARGPFGDEALRQRGHAGGEKRVDGERVVEHLSRLVL
jgi:hypothetical protein